MARAPDSYAYPFAEPASLLNLRALSQLDLGSGMNYVLFAHLMALQDEVTNLAWIRQADLARDMGIPRQAVAKGMKKLIDAGVLVQREGKLLFNEDIVITDQEKVRQYAWEMDNRVGKL